MLPLVPKSGRFIQHEVAGAYGTYGLSLTRWIHPSSSIRFQPTCNAFNIEVLLDAISVDRNELRPIEFWAPNVRRQTPQLL